MARNLSRSAVVVGLVGLVVTALTALPADSSTAPAGPEVVASWRMNDAGGSRRMVDSSGHGHHGAISRRADDAGLTSNGRYYKWAMRCPSCPPTALPRVVQVPDSAELDIPDPDVRWSIRFRFRTGKANTNILQKGQATSYGGQIKVENPHGRLTCVFLGAGGTYVSVQGTKRTDDAKWHIGRCQHTATSVSQWVDGDLVETASARTGPIDNSKPFVVGGKTDCDQAAVGCDYFSGRIDWVRLTRG